VNKKDKVAVALKYSSEDDAPKIIAKGKGIVANNIIEKGIDEGVNVHEDRGLVKELMRIDLGDEIPEDLYKAVATILAFIYEIDSKKGS